MAKKRNKKAAKTSRRSRRPRQSARGEMERLADEGEIEALIEALATGWATDLIEPRHKADLLRRAVRAHADMGVEALIEATFRAMFQFDAQFLHRCQAQILADLEVADRGLAGTPAAPPPRTVKEMLPRLMDIEERMMTLAERYAKVRRILAQAEAAEAVSHQIRNGGPMPAKPTGRVVPLHPERCAQRR